MQFMKGDEIMKKLIDDAISKGLISVTRPVTFGERISQIIIIPEERKLLLKVPLHLLAMEDEIHDFWYWQDFGRVNNN